VHEGSVLWRLLTPPPTPFSLSLSLSLTLSRLPPPAATSCGPIYRTLRLRRIGNAVVPHAVPSGSFPAIVLLPCPPRGLFWREKGFCFSLRGPSVFRASAPRLTPPRPTAQPNVTLLAARSFHGTTHAPRSQAAYWLSTCHRASLIFFLHRLSSLPPLVLVLVCARVHPGALLFSPPCRPGSRRRRRHAVKRDFQHCAEVTLFTVYVPGAGTSLPLALGPSTKPHTHPSRSLVQQMKHVSQAFGPLTYVICSPTPLTLALSRSLCFFLPAL
jgi:hypothetical protein